MKRKKLLELMETSFKGFKSSPLVSFLQSKLYQRSGRNEEALDILARRSRGNDYSEFLYLEYLEGLGKLRKLDSACIVHFETFTSHFKGSHFIKEAYQKLAWAHLVFNHNIDKYNRYMDLVKTRGSMLTDDDKQAYHESRSGIIPDSVLLKGRLLYDGGYYQEALDELNDYRKVLLKPSKQLEYDYRLGRIFQAQQNFDKAKESYKKVLSRKDDRSYFSCNAALQLGTIYEQEGDLILAKKYFELCLDMDPDAYKQSLHQKARSGLNRIGIK